MIMMTTMKRGEEDIDVGDDDDDREKGREIERGGMGGKEGVRKGD